MPLPLPTEILLRLCAVTVALAWALVRACLPDLWPRAATRIALTLFTALVLGGLCAVALSLPDRAWPWMLSTLTFLAVAPATRLVAQLRPRLGVFAILGNHEYHPGIRRTLRAFDRGAASGRALVERAGVSRYPYGRYAKGESQLYTSAGFGHWFPGRASVPGRGAAGRARAGVSAPPFARVRGTRGRVTEARSAHGFCE